MEAKDWPQLYAITDLSMLGDASLISCMGTSMKRWCAGRWHTSPGAFDAMVKQGLRPPLGRVLAAGKGAEWVWRALGNSTDRELSRQTGLSPSV